MNRLVLTLLLLSIVAVGSASAIDLASVSLGFHLIPALEAPQGERAWDLSLSFGVAVRLTAVDRVDVAAMIDSKPSALGTTLSYTRGVTAGFSAGGGLTVLWPFAGETRLLSPLFEAFAHADVRGNVGTSVAAGAGFSFPLVSVARIDDGGWDVMPLADLPSLALSAKIRLVESGILETRLTFQPVVTDVAALDRPIGRVTDRLLVLPMVSALIDFAP